MEEYQNPPPRNLKQLNVAYEDCSLFRLQFSHHCWCQGLDNSSRLGEEDGPSSTGLLSSVSGFHPLDRTPRCDNQNTSDITKWPLRGNHWRKQACIESVSCSWPHGTEVMKSRSHAITFQGGPRKIGSELFSTLSVHNYFTLIVIIIKGRTFYIL